MLSDQEKGRIRAEEVYRHEVRESLNRKDPSLWDLLNSSFVLWFLSSIVLATLTAAYGSCSTARETTRTRTERGMLLATELHSRALQFLDAISSDRAEPKRYWDLLFRPPHQNLATYALYPEFERRPTESLDEELERILLASGASPESEERVGWSTAHQALLALKAQLKTSPLDMKLVSQSGATLLDGVIKVRQVLQDKYYSP